MVSRGRQQMEFYVIRQDALSIATYVPDILLFEATFLLPILHYTPRRCFCISAHVWMHTLAGHAVQEVAAGATF